MIDPALNENGPAIDSRVLRQFAGLWLAVFGALATWNVLGAERPWLSIAFAVIALLVGIPGLIRPTAIRVVFLVAMAATTPIGRVVSLLLLAALYYLVFAPLGLVFRAIGRDALTRRRNARSTTHWLARTQITDARRYLHQA